MSGKKFNVLFLCTGNSARSVLAECVLNRLGQGRFRAYSAGSQPTGAVNPYALELLRSLDYDVSGLRSKTWDEFSGEEAPEIDFICTVCDNAAGETCPLWPGHPVSAHWGLPDPAAVTGSDEEKRLAFANTVEELTRRIELFRDLPFEALDPEELRTRLDDIGRLGKSAD